MPAPENQDKNHWPTKYCEVCNRPLKIICRRDVKRKRYCSQKCAGMAFAQKCPDATKKALRARQGICEKRRNAILKLGQKSCSVCGKVKPISDFYKCSKALVGYQSECKACVSNRGTEYWQNGGRQKGQKRRIKRLMIELGSTYEEYLHLIKRQDSCCPICNRKVDILVIDHSHENNKFRGLICADCNKGLGFFKDNEAIIIAAAAYLSAARRNKNTG